MPVVITDSNFEAEVTKSNTPVLLDFWASWCQPCRMLSPTIDALATEFDGKAKVGKVNVDENREISSDYGIMSIPTVLIFHKGELVEQFVGVQPKATYEDAIKKYL
ncbi:MAG: thioredoxin [Deferribacteraceae bacterium]|nr:thioredoxin [Deferribacteraceae bacterium]